MRKCFVLFFVFLCVNEFAETCVGWTKEQLQRAILNWTSDPLKVFLILFILSRQHLLRLRWSSYHIIFSNSFPEGHESLTPANPSPNILVLALGCGVVKTFLEFVKLCLKILLTCLKVILIVFCSGRNNDSFWSVKN